MEGIRGEREGTDVHARSNALERQAARAQVMVPRLEGSQAHIALELFRMLAEGEPVSHEQIAEALLERMSDGSVEAASAGSHPKPLHPNAVRVLKKRGIDISANRTKHLDEFLSQRFDMVITLCDRLREVCPEFPSHPQLVHWSVPDPALEGPTDRAPYPAFERTATELETRISFLLHLLARPQTTRRSSHAAQ